MLPSSVTSCILTLAHQTSGYILTFPFLCLNIALAFVSQKLLKVTK
jgi:hypothetical protein